MEGVVTPRSCLTSTAAYLAKFKYKDGGFGDNAVFVIPRLFSMRDQVRQATSVARALKNVLDKARKGALKKPETLGRKGPPVGAAPRVLVVGGGVTGAAVASCLAERGVRTTLVERQQHLFSLQRGCTTRWLHPYEYDWPLAHCENEIYPSTAKDKKAAPEALKWKAGDADSIAKVLDGRMNYYSRTLSKALLTLQPGMGAEIASGDRNQLLAQILTDGAQTSFPLVGGNKYSATILCLGGEEKGLSGTAFASFKYWQKDPYANDHMGKPRSSDCRKVLIAGAGDSALQDLIRTTLKHTHPPILFSRLPSGTDRHPRLHSALAILTNVLPALKKSAAFKAYVAGAQSDRCPFRPDPQILWESHQNLLATMSTEPAWEEISRKMRRQFLDDFKSGFRKVEFVLPKATLGKAYALNSFLYHLLNAVVKHGDDGAKPQLVVRDFSRLQDVTSVTPHHACARDAHACHHAAHSATRSGSSSPPMTSEFDVVILRLGVGQVLDSKGGASGNATP